MVRRRHGGVQSDQVTVRRSVGGVLALLVMVAGCAQRQELLVHCWHDGQISPLYLEAFLEQHPLAEGDALRMDEVDRSAAASYHIVQIRGRERPHLHQHHDLTATLLSGRGRLYLGTTVLAMDAGAVVTIPRGVVHYFVCDAPDQVAVAYVVAAPPLDEPDLVYVDVAHAGGWRWWSESATAHGMVTRR